MNVKNIASCLAVGYPEFLAKFKVGEDSLASWLEKVEFVMLRLSRLESASMGRSFRIGEVDVHSLSIWHALVPLPEIRSSRRLFVCWSRPIGMPLLQFWEQQGMITSVSWLETAPPCLAELGGALGHGL